VVSKLHIKKGLFIISVSAILVLFLNVYFTTPFSIQEIKLLVASKSVLFRALGNSNFIDFAKSSGFITSPIPIITNLLFVLLLPHSFILAKIPNIFLLLGVLLLYKNILANNIFESLSKEVKFILPVLLATSPWLIQAAIYNPSNLISLIFFVFSITYLKRVYFDKTPAKSDAYLLFASFILLSLSSFQGILAASTLFLASIFFYFKTKINSRINFTAPLLATLILLSSNILINKNYLLSKLNQGSLFTKISLTKLSHDIDERQRIDYLSSNKNFILPSLVRKFTYNKLSLATDRVIRKSISLLDFEQLASPIESYDIIKLSGILPKGNLPLYYVWELPLIVYGVFQLFKKNRNLKLWFAAVLISSLVPVIIFEKNDFSQYGIFLHASVFILTLLGLKEITKGMNNFKLVFKSIFFVFIFLVIISYLNFLNLVYKKQSNYLKPNTLQYQQIANWVDKNIDNDQEVVITNRFGPTQLAIPTYLNLSFDNYWDDYDQAQMTNQNLTFLSFDLLSQVPKNGIVYIGFPGEFVGVSKHHDISMLPASYELLGVLKSSDESVYQFGKDLWVVKTK
jgi:hypothetical protein